MVTSTLEEQFLAIVCADDELVRAEFEAIIDASWDEPPPSRPARRPPYQPPGGVLYRAADTGTDVAPPPPGVPRWVRQRSPPR